MPIYDATPTITSTSPAPLELDTNSDRVFQVDGFGFGRATPVVQISPASGGLTVQRVDFLTLPDGRPTPFARFGLTLRGGASPGTYTIRLVSIGSGSNGFLNGPNSTSTSAAYTVVVKEPQFRLTLRGQPVTHNQTIWIDPIDPTTPFRASLTTVNTEGDFDFRVVSTHRDSRDNTTSLSVPTLAPYQQTEDLFFCRIGVGQVSECEFPGLVTGGNVNFSWRIRPAVGIN